MRNELDSLLGTLGAEAEEALALIGAESHGAVLQTVDRRRRALATLARRFPLTGDARMLALATLLAEGYTVGELTAHPDMPSDERTLTRWAHELSALVA
jgi:hypothetical protein